MTARRRRGARRVAISALLGLGVLLDACCCRARFAYQGDGAFSQTCQTFSLDLGTIDLTTAGTHELAVGALPRADRWVLGLHVDPQGGDAAGSIGGAVVEISLTTRDGAPVIAERAPLARWSWNMTPSHQVGVGPAFVYRAGTSPTQDAVPRPKVVPAGRGRGTFFKPAGESTYRLVVRVVEPAADGRNFEVRLLAKGSDEIGSL